MAVRMNLIRLRPWTDVNAAQIAKSYCTGDIIGWECGHGYSEFGPSFERSGVRRSNS